MIFLIDQSNSMSGTTIDGRTIPASDPTGLRQYAPAFALSWIVHQNGDPRSPVTDVLGEVGFGGTASVGLPLTAIAAGGQGPAAGAEQERLAQAFRLEKLGDTDLRPAFAAAAAQFARQSRACGDQVGQRAMILVTDGGPCVATMGCDPAAPYWPGDRAYLKQVFSEVGSTFDPADYRLWVLTLARPGAPDLERTRPQWQDLARRYRGQVIALRHDPVDLQETVGAILDELSRVPITPTASPTPVPPPSVTPTLVPATPTPLPTATPVVPPVPPHPPPAPGGPGLLAGVILAALAALGALAAYLFATYRPRGSLVFVGAADREERGRLEFRGWGPVTYLDAADCARALPSVGITSLTARAGPIVGGRTTVHLALIGADGHVVNHRFRDTEADFVDDRREAEVVYEATRVLPGLSAIFHRFRARRAHAVRLALVPWIALALVFVAAHSAEASAPVTVLDVPYVSQFDGSPYAGSNCGPASLTMVLRAYGVSISEGEVRAAVNRLQGTTAYDSGTALETIAAIVREHGLTPVGLMDSSHHARWTAASLSRAIAAGQPVIPEVRYRRLPGHANAAFDGDHYIVLIGVRDGQVVYQDPAFTGQTGADREISMGNLLQAMAASAFPDAAVAVAPGPDHAALRTETLGEDQSEESPGDANVAQAAPSHGEPAAPRNPVARGLVPPATGQAGDKPPRDEKGDQRLDKTAAGLHAAASRNQGTVSTTPVVTPIPSPVIVQPSAVPPVAALAHPAAAPTGSATSSQSTSDPSHLVITVTLSTPRLPSLPLLLRRLPSRPADLIKLPRVAPPRIALPAAPRLDPATPLTQLRAAALTGDELVRAAIAAARASATRLGSTLARARLEAFAPGAIGLAALTLALLGLARIRGRRDHPRGLDGQLRFVDLATDTALGQVCLTEHRRGVRWDLSRCAERLPAVGLARLCAEPGPVIEGKTTVRLTLVGPDGSTVLRLFRDRDRAALDDRGDRHVVYQAKPVYDSSGNGPGGG